MIATKTSGALGSFATAAALVIGWAGVAHSAAVANLDDGLIKFESEDGRFTAQIGGRIQQDWAFVKADDDAKEQLGLGSTDGAELRRGRFVIQGKFYSNVTYKAEWDFAAGRVEPKDVYFDINGLPFGALRTGHFYEPFSIEEVTSSKYSTFMERALTSGFVPSRNMGLALRNQIGDARGTWSVGVFREETESRPAVATGAAVYAETGRITLLPQYADDGRKLIHIGLGVSHRRPPSKMESYTLRPEAHLAPEMIETGSFSAQRAVLLDAEAAVVAGPLSLQGEFLAASHAGEDIGDTDNEMDPMFTAFYAQLGYFVTGESKAYKTKDGIFDRVKPTRNFGDGDGAIGALELAARFSMADLDDEDNGVGGGTLSDVTVGANWHLNPNTRIMLNYVFASASDVGFETGKSQGEGGLQILQTRFQVEF